MTDGDKLAIQQAKASTWKKILIWSIVVVVFCTLVAVLLIVVLQRKSPVGAVDAVVARAKHQAAKADMDAKIKTAEARMVEDAVVAELKRIKEIEDEEERAKRLAELL
ncbi:hypothetical protein LCGC14_0645850 [marine sediment metagenome]|uniref:Uncharacterized protein n=1 Tax=marine sediment metagenome TaxID=412755 RepID=A0A0F9RHC8_9ZZZZ